MEITDRQESVMTKKQWKRAYQLSRFAFRDEKQAYIEANEEGLVKDMHFARKFWVKGNTNWENCDVITRFRDAYQRKKHEIY